MKRADKVAIQRLRTAERYMNEGNRHAFYEELLRALWGYISDKFNIPVSNLTKERIREELYRRNVSMAIAEEFCEIISRSEEAQYSPSTDGEMSEAYATAVDIMSKIEDAIKR
jgi:signal recognition particle GTPase